MITNNTEPRTPANLTAKHGGVRHSDLAVPPGEYLKEVIGEIGIGKAKLARQLDIPIAEMDALLTGSVPLTQDVAERLEKATNVPANIWFGLEAEYRLTLIREAKDER